MNPSSAPASIAPHHTPPFRCSKYIVEGGGDAFDQVPTCTTYKLMLIAWPLRCLFQCLFRSLKHHMLPFFAPLFRPPWRPSSTRQPALGTRGVAWQVSCTSWRLLAARHAALATRGQVRDDQVLSPRAVGFGLPDVAGLWGKRSGSLQMGKPHGASGFFDLVDSQCCNRWNGFLCPNSVQLAGSLAGERKNKHMQA